MERFEADGSGALAALADAVERGEAVEIVRDGRTVADVVRRMPAARQDDAFWAEFWRKLRELQELVPPAARGGEGLVARMREEED